jgi:hypothetical protein
MCAEWRDDFAAFLRDMGTRPVGTSLDRIDVNGDYSAQNCRWATRSQQMRNKRNNLNVTIAGETRCIADWIVLFGLQPSCVYGRIRNGWDAVAALTTPLQRRRA